MSDHRADSAADRMSRAVARLGMRLHDLLARTPSAQDGSLAHGLAFLAAMVETTDDVEETAQDEDPIERLSRALALTRLERDLITLAGMADEHEGYASLLRSLHPRGEPRATAGLAAQLACPTRHDRLVLRETLVRGAGCRAGLIAIGGDAPFFEQDLTLADRLWPVLCGLDVYPGSVTPLDITPATAGLGDWLASPDVQCAMRALAAGEDRLVIVSSDTEQIALCRAVALAAAAGRACAAFEIAANAPPGTCQLAALHGIARGLVPVFKIVPADGSAPPSIATLDRLRGPSIACVGRWAAAGGWREMRLAIETPRLTGPACARMWRDTLPELAGEAPLLASRYALEPSMAADVAADVRARHALADAPIDLDSVARCVRLRCSPPPTTGITMVRPQADWDRLVLRADRKALLREAVDRLRHQGLVLDDWKFLDGRPGARGVRLLFSGPPGTGKTLAAEVLARSLGVDLMVVDISRIVSKWIGETEKHLSGAFDAAERTQAVLLFDEADALFGKRTEISDAHDRYANLETAYLLSRLERFDGLAVLSTNLKQNIDPAFIRRIEFVIEFEEPTLVERETLWRCHLPAEAPLAADVDLRELAALYPVVGGLIRNASVAAGFLAAARAEAIGRDHLIGAIRREYDKSAKAFPGAPSGARPA